jgi:hypothetical protein
MREFWQISDDSGSAVEDRLKLAYPGLWETRKDGIAKIQSVQHKRVDKSGGGFV